MPEKIYRTGIYTRLSREDNEEGTSNSIAAQTAICMNYISCHPDLALTEIYDEDDGYSGTNMDRPGFDRMMQDIRQGRIDCAVSKDLSRFSRNYMEAGYYLENLFPLLGIRYIAVNDGYDSLTADTSFYSIMLPFKNLINDSYCRDISMKIKSQLAAKRKAGECLSPFAVYGYQKHPQNKNKLIIDSYAAEIVRTIFAWKIKGMAVSAIAERLNAFGILSPREYKKLTGANYRGGFLGDNISKWGSQTVKRILTDEVYLGHLVQGKTEKLNDKINRRIKKPREEWVRAEYTHEPIIAPLDFQIVQNLLESSSRISPKTGERNPFAGLLFCADCRSQMVRRMISSKNSRKVYYICSANNRGKGCTRHSIEETALRKRIETSLYHYIHHLPAQEKSGTNEQTAKFLHTQETERLNREKEKYQRLCSKLYADSRQGMITKEEFEHLHEKFTQKITYLCTSQDRQKEFWLKFSSDENNTPDFSRFVKRIWVYEGKQIEIEFYKS